MSDLSKTQVDKLGSRLRKGDPTDEDLVLLDQFRRSYSSGYEQVIAIIRDKLGFEPTGRPAKSTNAIVAKLKRESIRLSQIQDLAGCRFIVGGAHEQDKAAATLIEEFSDSKLDDRRERPSHGYRAIHVIAVYERKPIEIQIRTVVQHAWAELSEKLSDLVDPLVKYGGGPDQVQGVLARISAEISRLETLEGTSGKEVEAQRILTWEMLRVGHQITDRFFRRDS